MTKGSRILILFDNFAKDRRFPSGWGFSALVEVSGRRVLFDAGPGRVLTALEAAGVPLRSLDAVVISHLHADHYGGVDEVLAGKPGIPLFVPGRLPPELKAPWQVLSALTEVRSPVEVVPGVWVTAPVGSRLPEMALAVRAPIGVAMLTGSPTPVRRSWQRQLRKRSVPRRRWWSAGCTRWGCAPARSARLPRS